MMVIKANWGVIVMKKQIFEIFHKVAGLLE
jgi:hypothetical protein